jgi:hypothetical protein
MRRRSAPPPSAQQMIREYLGRVSVAATKVLPKGDRLLFVGRTRAAIEAKVGPLASADADAVLDALTTMGDPQELAERERERLYSARRRGAAAAPPALWKPSKDSRRGAAGSRRGAAGSRGGAAPPPAREEGAPQGRRRPRPWPHRGLTGPDEPQPAEPGSPPVSPDSVPAVPRQADSPEVVSPPVAASPPPEVSPPAEVSPSPRAPRPTGAPRDEVPRPRMPPEQAIEEGWPAEPSPAEPSPAEPSPAESAAGGNAPTAGIPVPDLAGLEADAPEPDAPEADAPGAQAPGADAPVSGGPEQNGTPPGWLRPGRPTPAPAPAPGEAKPLSIVPGMSESGEPDDHPAAGRRSVAGWRSPVVALLAEAWALARKHPLEAVAVVLLGLGGLILPFPFWLIGGLVALRSRRWDARDKWIALAGPPLVTFMVLLIRAATSAGNFFSAFYHAAGNDVGVSIRVGCVLCAGYLIWRLRRGPRLRTLPPWQRPRRR